MGTDGGRNLETVERAISIVEAIQELDGARVTELADHLGLAQSTVHGYLATLKRNRYLVKDGDEYHIGMKFLQVGGYVTTRDPGYNFARQKVRELAKETGERAQFIVEEYGRGTYLHTETEDPAVQIDARIGKERPLHVSAAGKAILSTFPREDVDAVIDQWGLEALTENTITDREELHEELEETAERGFSLNREESVNGLRAVGAPIMRPAGGCLGSLSVSAPANRFKGDRFTEEVPLLLLGAVNDVELRLAYQ